MAYRLCNALARSLAVRLAHSLTALAFYVILTFLSFLQDPVLDWSRDISGHAGKSHVLRRVSKHQLDRRADPRAHYICRNYISCEKDFSKVEIKPAHVSLKSAFYNCKYVLNFAKAI